MPVTRAFLTIILVLSSTAAAQNKVLELDGQDSYVAGDGNEPGIDETL